MRKNKSYTPGQAGATSLAGGQASSAVMQDELDFRGIVEAIPHLLWVSCPEGNNEFVSQRCLDYTGISLGEAVSHWVRALHPDDKDRAYSCWSTAVRTGTDFECEYRLKGSDGRYRWFLGRATAVRNELGAVARWIGTATEIEGQKQQLQDLVDSREQFRVILENVKDGIMVLNSEHKFIYANPAAVRLCGFSAEEELLRLPTSELMGRFELLDENGAPVPPEELPGRKALQGVLNPQERLVQVRSRTTGNQTWSLLNAAPVFDSDGKVKFGVCIFRDYTLKKRAEDTLRLLAQSGLQFASSLDIRTVLQNVAELAVTTLADWCTIALREVPHADPVTIAVAHRDPARAEWARGFLERNPRDWGVAQGGGRVLASGRPEVVTEVSEELLRDAFPDENRFREIRGLGLRSVIQVPLKGRSVVHGVLTVATAESGRLYRPEDVCVVEEIAARAALAFENALLYKDTQEAVRSRDEFFSVASHELKTPLTTLKLQSQLLQRTMARGGDPGPEEFRRFVDSVVKQSDRLTRLVEDMLDISHISAGTLGVRWGSACLSSIVREVATRMSAELEKAGCELRMSVEPDVGGEWDRQRLEQVFQNLLTNAMKFGAGKPVEVRVFRQGNEAFLKVKDFGIGIAKSDQGRIFQKFERAVSPGQAGGMGLGLFIARQLVELHGGSLSLESELGKGAEFAVRIPVNRGNKDAQQDSDRRR